MYFLPAMKSPRISSPATVLGALSLILLPAVQGIGQTATATTDPVGYAQTACLANTDTKLSLPFSRPAEFVGAIGSISSSTIAVASTPNWATNQYVYGSSTENDASKTYYAIIGPNITALANPVSVTNASTTVTGSGLTNIATGDELLVSGLAYNVASVSGDGTSLVIDHPYTGTTASGLSASYDHSPKEGCYYTVTANDASTVTVNLNNDSLGAVTAGTTVSLIPYWTLITAFPTTDAGTSYVASTSTSPAPTARGTQIFTPDLTTAGINLASNATYYYYSNWRKVGSASNFNDTILPPTTYFTLRNPATATTFTPSGGVYMNRVSIALDTQSSAAQDNAVAVPRPAGVTLDQLDLVATGAFTPSTNTNATGRKDQLFVYDNTVAGINKSASATYYYYGGMWRVLGSTANAGSTSIPYGSGFIIRKAANGTGVTSFYQNARNY